MADALNQEEQKILIDLARKSLISFIKEGKKLKVNENELPKIFKEKRACFVTYKIGENLRGCIGSLYAEIPLYKEVIRRAIDAAVNDTRFPRVSIKELDKIKIDVSVLTPMKKISSIEEFEVGKHGILISKNDNRAVYLPQVATEQGWNKEQTLSHLSMKAGLSPDAWKKNAEFSIFESQIIEEI